MKKMSIACMMVICLATSGFSRASNALDLYLGTPEHEIEDLRKELKDTKKMRECALQLALSAWHIRGISPEQAEKFKRISGLNNKVMETAFLDIIREWSAKEGWSSWDERLFSPNSARIGYAYLRGAIMWLGYYADAEGKKTLTGVFMDNAKDGEFRVSAIHSYMGRADAQERWDTIVRLLGDDVRSSILPVFNVYDAAMREYDKAEGDTQKRKAIVDAVTAVLAKEENKKAFTEADTNLAERSKEYAESPQRKAALERINKPPDKLNP